MDDKPVTHEEANNVSQQLIDGANREGVDTYTKTILWHASSLIDRLLNQLEASRWRPEGARATPPITDASRETIFDGAVDYARICKAAMGAAKRMQAREGEDVDKWARTLGADLAAAGDIETAAMASPPTTDDVKRYSNAGLRGAVAEAKREQGILREAFAKQSTTDDGAGSN